MTRAGTGCSDRAAGTGDQAEANDHFGKHLKSGDFDADGLADLAVGISDEDIGSISGAGAVHIYHGDPGTGLSFAGDDFWHQDSSSILDTAEAFDSMGYALQVSDFDGDGYADLAVGVLNEDVAIGSATIDRAGMVQVMFGTSSGVHNYDQLITQEWAGVAEISEVLDWFGGGL